MRKNKYQSCDDDGWKVRRLTLDQENFPLPLGWMLSDTTEKLVASLVGDFRFVQSLSQVPEFERLQNNKYHRAANILFKNSCTLHSITRLLSGPDAESRLPAPELAQPWEAVTRWSDVSSESQEDY